MSWKKELQIATQAAREAGRILRNFNRQAVISDIGRDLKHQGDRESEEAILKFLAKESDYPILAEETGEHEGDHSDHLKWIIDPLDGTLNYSRDIPFCCVSVGLWRREAPVLGVIYDFMREEMFTGVSGQGAWLNEVRISANSAVPQEKAVLATGFPINRDFSNESIQHFLKKIQSFKKVRLFGSAALSLAYVACGRIDGYTEEDIMLWDVAAGLSLVLAAGGYVNLEKSGQKKWARTVYAGNVFADRAGSAGG
jgi:myo-inositol-1(or 4)-monophosphatase